MKKVSTYYFLGIVVMSLLFGSWVGQATKMFAGAFHRLLEGKPLPPLTNWVIAYSYWPYLVAAFGGVGLILSLGTRLKSETLTHAAVALALLSLMVAVASLLAFAVPLHIPPMYEMSP